MRLYVAAAAVLFLAAAAIAITGGVKGTFHGIPYGATRVLPASIGGWALLLVARRRDRPSFDARIVRLQTRVRSSATPIAAGLAVATFVVALLFGAPFAAGADPYAYVSQGELWAGGNPAQLQPPIALDARWPEAQWSFCPLGYRPSSVSGVIVPTMPQGLPLQMAALIRVFGARGAYLVVPLAGALLVWLTYAVGRRVCASAEAAVVAALLTAASPVFLYQLMMPMSDVPAAAWWLGSFAAASEGSFVGALGAGATATMAILTRPNLVPLAIPVAALAVAGGASIRGAGARLCAFGLGLLPGVALTAWMNAVFFGSPLSSGYGRPSEIYHASYALTNLARYTSWFWQSHSPFIFVALAAPFVGGIGRRAAAPLAFAAVLAGCYLVYLPFDHWNYLRFLLPAIPLLLILAAAAVDVVSAKRYPAIHAIALAMVVTILLPWYVRWAVGGDAFALRALFRDRYPIAAAAASERTPERAVVFATLQSGSLRYYAGRLTVRSDIIDPAWLEASISYFEQHGRTPYLALESTEIDGFRARFGPAGASMLNAAVGRLDPKGLVRLFGPPATRQPK